LRFPLPNLPKGRKSKFRAKTAPWSFLQLKISPLCSTKDEKIHGFR